MSTLVLSQRHIRQSEAEQWLRDRPYLCADDHSDLVLPGRRVTDNLLSLVTDRIIQRIGPTAALIWFVLDERRRVRMDPEVLATSLGVRVDTVYSATARLVWAGIASIGAGPEGDCLGLPQMGGAS